MRAWQRLIVILPRLNVMISPSLRGNKVAICITSNGSVVLVEDMGISSISSIGAQSSKRLCCCLLDSCPREQSISISSSKQMRFSDLRESLDAWRVRNRGEERLAIVVSSSVV